MALITDEKELITPLTGLEIHMAPRMGLKEFVTLQIDPSPNKD